MKIRELEDRIKEFQARGCHQEGPLDCCDQTPFANGIINEPVPARFKMPSMDQYDRSTDPVDYLEGFKALMHLQDASDSLLCLALPATLKKAARTWFIGILPKSVTSFQ